MEKICGIYKFTNNLNGKVYIGKSVNIHSRYKAHIRAAKRFAEYDKHQNITIALHKYGINNFTFDIICSCNKKELNDKEIFYINYYNSINNGYNICKGGEGAVIISEKNKKKRSNTIRNKWQDPNYREKQRLSRLNKPRMSEETKDKLRKNHNPNSAWNKGGHCSEEWRIKLRESHKDQKPTEYCIQRLKEHFIGTHRVYRKDGTWYMSK